MRTALPIAAGYRRVIFEALGSQVILGILALMVLDGGKVAHTVGIAVLAFWLGTALIVVRRPAKPTRADLWLIRFGFLPLLVIAFPLAAWIWSWHWLWTI